MIPEIKKLRDLGFKVFERKNLLEIEYNGNTITYYKKKKWYSGKGIKDGRGFEELIQELNGSVKSEDQEIDFYNNNPESYNAIIGIFQKHFGKKIPQQYQEGIKADLKRRFDIKLKTKL